MSITASHKIYCDCGAQISVFVCNSLNPERHPHFRDALMERTLHVFECGACGKRVAVENRMTYVDLGRKQFCAVAPEAERHLERQLGEELAAAWRIALGDDAPASVRALFDADSFHVRLCFGLEELREKLVAREAGLRDLPLEAFKGELMAANPEWSDAGVRTLRLDHVEEDGRLAFFFERATQPPTVLDGGLLCDRARYDELAAMPWRSLLDERPWLASGPHVSLLRLSLPKVAEAAHAEE